MIPQLTLVGGLHAAAALFCIAIGAIQFVRPKHARRAAPRPWLRRVSAVVSVLVTAIGYVMIARYRPPPEAAASGQAIIAEQGIAS
jgi:hypothetical protein